MKHLVPGEIEIFAIDVICDEKPLVHGLEFHFALFYPNGRESCACRFSTRIQKEWLPKCKIGQSPCSVGILPEVDKCLQVREDDFSKFVSFVSRKLDWFENSDSSR